jgi:hypothetical protein
MCSRKANSHRVAQDRILTCSVFIVFAALVAFVLTQRFPLHYSLRLPNGYVLIRLLDSDDVSIEGRCPVPPKIVLIQASGDVVFGVLEPYGIDFRLGKPECFVLNTVSGKLLTGLSSDDFRACLRKYKIDAIHLRSPYSYRPYWWQFWKEHSIPS